MGNPTPKLRKDILYPELSYKIQGAILEVAKKYGPGFKEIIYQNALIEVLEAMGLKVDAQKRIEIYSLDTGKVLGTYVPDLVVEDLIPIELKATSVVYYQDIKQDLSYLKASKYELGYLVNFGTPTVFIKRIIYTNDRKPFLKMLVS